MKNFPKGFVRPLILVLIVLLAFGGGMYFYEQKSKIAPELDWKLFRADVSAQFEGTDTLSYAFNYPKSISIQPSKENRKLILTDAVSGKIDVITIGYEGGRGYSVQDMYNEQIKRDCADCVIVPNKISAKNDSNLITVIGKDKKWLIFSSASKLWLITVKTSTDNTVIEQIISTFELVG